jgi:hypothetical protein
MMAKMARNIVQNFFIIGIYLFYDI